MVNIQTIREQLAVRLVDVLPSGWSATSETTPEHRANLLQVGHARSIVPGTYRGLRVDLEVFLWVSEAESTARVAELYGLLSPGDGNVLAAIRSVVAGLDGVTIAGEVVGGDVGERDEGPSGFIAASILVPLLVK